MSIRIIPWLLVALAAGGLWPAGTTAAGKDAGPRRRNVVFIVCDDLNNRLGCYGWDEVKSPALDGLAREGLRFDRAYCQYPVCNPSRSSFLTGWRPERTGILDNKVKLRDVHPHVTTLPQCFKEQGYWTGGVGKVYHGHMDDGERSWHVYRAFENERNPVIERVRRAFEATHGAVDKPENRRAWGAKLRSIRKEAAGQTPAGYGPTDMTDAEHRDGKNVRQIIQWLETRAYGEKPFFIAWGIRKPHIPLWAPQKYFDLYPPAGIRFLQDPPDDWDDVPPEALSMRHRTFGVPAGDDAKRREVTAAYYACVTFLDAQCGLLFDALKRLNLWDETIIVFTSDHGFHLGEHGMWGKVTLFEEAARVPLLVRVPGVTKPGSVSQGLVELVDLYPTLADLCGLRYSDDLDGSSFAPLLSQPDRPWKRAAFTMVKRGSRLPGRALRTGRWRYAEWGSPEKNELYDLARDPRELTNLAGGPGHAETIARMRSLLHEEKKAALPPR